MNMRYQDLLRYRQGWMGLAILWIILFHLRLVVEGSHFFWTMGYCGVDIFLFASGIGCFFSLSSDGDPGRFLKRRLRRLMPTYLIFMVPWLVYQWFLGNLGLRMALGNVFVVQFFAEKEKAFNWYISGIVLLYLLAPYFKSVVDRGPPLAKACVLLALLAGSVPFWNSHPFLILASRVPIFYMGMLFGDLCRNNPKISPVHMGVAAGAFLGGFGGLMILGAWIPDTVRTCGLGWYACILTVPPMCMAISYILRLLEGTKMTKPLVSFLNLCGAYSFELYLLHIPMVSILLKWIRQHDLSQIAGLVWLAGAVVLGAACFALKRLAALAVHVFFH